MAKLSENQDVNSSVFDLHKEQDSIFLGKLEKNTGNVSKEATNVIRKEE